MRNFNEKMDVKLYTIPHCKIMYTNDIIYSSIFGSCQKQTYG